MCYRRADSEEVVDRIYDTLAEHFREEALFRDLDDVAPGINFPTEIQQRLRDCQVVLVLIGREWVTMTDEQGRRRLDDPKDHVRIELQTALSLPHARVIPVLVRRAVIPKAEQLPGSLRQLLDLNALTLRSSGRDYKQDIATLVKAIRDAIVEVAAERAVAAERERQRSEREEGRRREWAAQCMGPLPRPLAEDQWEELLVAVAAGRVVTICGSDFGADPKTGEDVSCETHLAVHVAEALGLPVPPVEARRPLAQLAIRYRQDGGPPLHFAHALRRAAEAPAPPPAVAPQALQRIEPLRFFLTSALDRALEAILALRCERPIASIAYTPAKPFALDDIDLTLVPALVFHVAGSPDGLPGSTAVTDAEWLDFADALQARERQPGKLLELLEDRDLLFLGGGHPVGFVEFWVRLAPRQSRCWIGTSVFDQNPSLAGFLRDDAGRHQVLFDDSGEPTFLADLARRWAERVAAQSPALAHGEPPTSGALTPGSPPVPTDRQAVAPLDLRDGRPWPGLMAFSEEQQFWGRGDEIRQVIRALRFHSVTVLHAPSGMGKTSMLRAGVLPALRARGVVPVLIRLQWDEDAPPLGLQILQAVRVEAGRVGIPLPEPEPHISLWAFFHQREIMQLREGAEGPRFALLFDQFEEMFTLAGATRDREARARAGWTELADLVEGRLPAELRQLFDGDTETLLTTYDFAAPCPTVLFSLREDFLPELQALAKEMPSLSNRFRLSAFTGAQALEAVLRPGSGIFTEEAARALIRALAIGFRAAAQGPEDALETLRVEPALLSVFCYMLNEERLARGLPHVDASLLQQTSVGVLESFYQRAFSGFSPSLRHWVEDELVTVSGHRDSVALERAERELAKRGLPPEALNTLVDRRLLRVSVTGDTARIELVHDALLPLVRQSREARAPVQSAR